MTSLLASILVATAPTEGAIARADLLKVLRSARDAIHDIEFVYEGALHVIASPDYNQVPKGNRDPHPLGPNDAIRFQGRFASRDDGRAHLDYYRWRDPGPGDLSREVSCLPGDGRVHLRRYYPGEGPADAERVEPAGLDYFDQGEFPYYLDLNLGLIDRLSRQKNTFECKKWESLGGHNCLVIRIVEPNTLAHEYWIDLARQARPLRYDYYEGKVRTRQFTDVELAEFVAVDGSTHWFPIRSKFVRYTDLFTTLKTPATEETYGVVDGTMLINRGLKDDRFRLDYRPGDAGAPAGWKEAAAMVKKDGGALSPQRDASQSFDDRLGSMLTKADAQSKELKAKSPSDDGWFSRNLTQVGMMTVGAALIGSAWLLKRRGG